MKPTALDRKFNSLIKSFHSFSFAAKRSRTKKIGVGCKGSEIAFTFFSRCQPSSVNDFIYALLSFTKISNRFLLKLKLPFSLSIIKDCYKFLHLLSTFFCLFFSFSMSKCVGGFYFLLLLLSHILLISTAVVVVVVVFSFGESPWIIFNENHE